MVASGMVILIARTIVCRKVDHPIGLGEQNNGQCDARQKEQKKATSTWIQSHSIMGVPSQKGENTETLSE